jgi:hypothetical protein
MKKNELLTLMPVIALGFGLVLSATAVPGHGYVSIPAAAFQPTYNTYQYENNGHYLTAGSSQNYVAPVQLPNGVTVTKVTFYFYDESSANDDYAVVNLFRNNNNGSDYPMAYIWSNDSGYSSTYDDSIDFPLIDNSQYSYFLNLWLNSTNVSAYAVIIEYTNPVSLPLVMR